MNMEPSEPRRTSAFGWPFIPDDVGQVDIPGQDLPVDETQEDADIRHLREQADRAAAAEKAGAALRRERGFLLAGIDVDSKLGRLLVKSYGDGDPEGIPAWLAENT